jgi:hypothetical protein
MSDRSWFYAAQGQQQGPFPEAQFRNLIARNTVTADTLVWTDGMSGWQRCGDVPGLTSGRSGPPAMPQPRGQQPATAGQYGAAGQFDGGGQYGASDQYAADRYGGGGGRLSFDVGVFALFGQSLLYAIGLFLVVPAPWLSTGYYRWATPKVQVPDRPNLGFTGQPMDIWWAFVGIGACTLIYFAINSIVVHLIAFLAVYYLYWIVLRWIVSNLSSNGQPLPITFDGNALTYVGWHVLLAISGITIIGWAWVIVAQMRWICRNIGGTNREILFRASGLEILWRGLVFGIACIFIIPIPWMMRWYVQWMVSQLELVDRA